MINQILLQNTPHKASSVTVFLALNPESGNHIHSIDTYRPNPLFLHTEGQSLVLPSQGHTVCRHSGATDLVRG